jgi:hypothetical protein
LPRQRTRAADDIQRHALARHRGGVMLGNAPVKPSTTIASLEFPADIDFPYQEVCAAATCH